jgi:triacylglycerol lipase
MGCPQSMLGPMAAWLRWLGFEPTIVAPRHGMACGEQSVTAVLQALGEITDGGRRKAVVLAHSRGGQFARVAAVRAPDMVAGLITLGSPTAGVFRVRARLALPLVGLGVVGSVGGGSVVGVGCLVGGCCRDVRRDLTAMLQPEVRFLSVFSRRDGVVSWRSCLDPSARLREVTCGHGAMVHEPAVMDAVEDELATLCSEAERTPTVVMGRAHRS